MRWNRILGLMLAVCVAAGAGATAAAVEKTNPVIFPNDDMIYRSYPDTVVNILLLGIDFGREGFWGSMYKKDILQCHTDAVMVFAVNLTKNRVDIISFPRDTVTIVPGVRGVYKLNGAVNCADTLAGGLKRSQAAVEKLLGGVKIDGYIAVDMNAMFTLGDALGGVDYMVDMDYVGSSGRLYNDGFQHLDGTGIMDYVRARSNATLDASDYGRTRRQREMMTAIFQKLMSDTGSALSVLDALSDPETNVFTNLTGAQAVGILALAPMLLRLDGDGISSYTIGGDYRNAMGWNFTITDNEYRAEVLKTVYGIDVAPLEYVSYGHAGFYADSGFYSVHVITIVNEFIENIGAMRLTLTGEQRELWERFIAAYEKTVDYFQRACDGLNSNDITEMKYARVEMRDLADAFAKSVGYGEELPWTFAPAEWYLDPYTNEYQYDWR
ncbi:MAG: LCP family protein [Clostridiales bacterium]|nr:LCP family protein [Clostridiales bacterium]